MDGKGDERAVHVLPIAREAALALQDRLIEETVAAALDGRLTPERAVAIVQQLAGNRRLLMLLENEQRVWQERQRKANAENTDQGHRTAHTS